MTTPRAAQEKPTSPRTEAGRALLDDLTEHVRSLSLENANDMWNATKAAILAIEHEAANIERAKNPLHYTGPGTYGPPLEDIEREAVAATPSLDVERLVASVHDADRAMRNDDGECFFCLWRDGHDNDPDCPMANLLVHAANVARLDEGSATPDPEEGR